MTSRRLVYFQKYITAPYFWTLNWVVSSFNPKSEVCTATMLALLKGN